MNALILSMHDRGHDWSIYANGKTYFKNDNQHAYGAFEALASACDNYLYSEIIKILKSFSSEYDQIILSNDLHVDIIKEPTYGE